MAIESNADRVRHVERESMEWAWLFLASSMLGLAGVGRIIDAIWAFRYKGPLPENLQGGVLGSDLKNYAWLWLAVGVVLITSSFLLMTRSQFARWVGFVAAGLCAVTAMTWMPYYPIWSVTYVGISLMVVYALARHAGRVPV